MHLRCPFLRTSQLWVRLIAFAGCDGWFGVRPARRGISDAKTRVWCALGRSGALMMYGRRDFFALVAMVEVCWFVEEVGIVVLIPALKNGFFTQRPWPTGGFPAVFGLPAAAAAWAKWPGWKTILSVVVVCGGPRPMQRNAFAVHSTTPWFGCT